jgi:hypothetical protein
MRKVITYSHYDSEAIERRRLEENLKLTPLERFEKAFYLIHLSMLFKRGPLKEPEGKGVVLRRKIKKK